MSKLTIIGIEGIGEIRPGDLLANAIADAASAQDTALADGDCLVVTQKIVSKAENRMVELAADDTDARRALIERESVRVLRRRGELLITETPHGFVCANAGIDVSNVADGWAALLPIDADRSARRIRDALRAQHGVEVAVIVSDTFGRAWREGLTDVAIGLAGIAGVVDLAGQPDALGKTLRVTAIAVADEVAAAAELVMGKAAGVPAAIVRGLDSAYLRASSVRELIRSPAQDLFR